MAENENGQEKTERATGKKRRDERKKGHVAMSKDVVTVVSLMGIFLCLRLLFPMIVESLQESLVYHISAVGTRNELSFGVQQEIGWQAVWVLLKCIFPLGLISIALAVIATGMQTRFLFTMDPLKFKLSKLNPVKGLINFFKPDLKKLVELLKSAVKIGILGIFLFTILSDEIDTITKMMDLAVIPSCTYVLNEILWMVIKIGMVFGAIAVFDIFYQHWTFEKDMKMTKEEVKEEYKQMEGDPKVKSKIRSIQQQRARSRMMQAVPDADVIIRNPTHYAVALKYDINLDNAPILVAKGQDSLALKIVEIGEQNGVTVIENKPLARGIYASTPLDGEIPAEYYGVVAEILVEIFRMNKKMV